MGIGNTFILISSFQVQLLSVDRVCIPLQLPITFQIFISGGSQTQSAAYFGIRNFDFTCEGDMGYQQMVMGYRRINE